jgi:ubiquinone/menaquinone biosynthesis C-methylase UbiE
MNSLQNAFVAACAGGARWLGIDLKRRKEFSYWGERWRSEGAVFSNEHYEHFYTSHFGVSRDCYMGRRILDIGCGPRGSLEWADMAAQRVGLDPLVPDYRKLGIARHKMEYVEAPSEAIPFPEGHFDVVCSFNSLDHVNDLHKTINEIIRVVAPGGLFLLLTDVNHGATFCEPNEYSWEIVDRFLPDLRIVEMRKYEKPEPGLYQSILRNIAYNNADATHRTAILSAKFQKLPSELPLFSDEQGIT